MMHCANCNIPENNDIKLKTCTACKSVRYCSIKCQKVHRPKHKKFCKKRAAELHDEILFKRPESSEMGDCPICCLPIPLEVEKFRVMVCCSKVVCLGCDYANQIRQMKDNCKNILCPFCRHRTPNTQAESDRSEMKRLEVNDPLALKRMGWTQHEMGNFDTAFDCYTRAAKKGDADAHFHLSGMYWFGQSVEKDEKMKVHHLEQASILGHVKARYNLGIHEWNLWVNHKVEGSSRRAMKHFLISSGHGCDRSLNFIKTGYEHGMATKEEYAAALRAHKDAVDAMKSPQRDEAEKALRDRTFIPAFVPK